MKKTIGVVAHVDAGKTTFCESLLYLNKEIANWGRVDHKNTLMDHDELEQKRGITIFTGIASFAYENHSYYLIDTPGHVDFSAEMERTLSVLDAAVLLVSAVDGVQSHTITLFNLLRDRGIPIYLFINKTDQEGVDIQWCLDDIQKKLSKDIFYIEESVDDQNEERIEWLSEYDDEMLTRFLEETLEPEFVKESIGRLVSSSSIIPVHTGSALKQEGIDALLHTMNQTLQERQYPYEGFAARVFKAAHDQQGNQVTFIKCLSGEIKVRDEILCQGSIQKVHQVRAYQGKSYQMIDKAEPGDIVGVTGLKNSIPGMGLGACEDIKAAVLKPALSASVQTGEYSHDEIMTCFRKLEAEDPMLQVNYEPVNQEIQICVMGKIQLEVLKELFLQRYGKNIEFGECQVVYKETILAAVVGYGHYEPLRHYAEVHLRMEPEPHSGIVFSSKCALDEVPLQYQNLIKHHVLERAHRGVLTGSQLTDVKVTLLAAGHHLKHTSGGDFKEAVYRAVRQGLEKAESVLLEPFYYFSIEVESSYMGRVLSDITRLSGTFDPPKIIGEQVQIKGRGPVATFLDYPSELLSFTKGSGAISMTFLDYFPCHNEEQVIAEIGYQRERDLEHVSSSVFCKKGAGFEVKWYEAESYMHLLK